MKARTNSLTQSIDFNQAQEYLRSNVFLPALHHLARALSTEPSESKSDNLTGKQATLPKLTTHISPVNTSHGHVSRVYIHMCVYIYIYICATRPSKPTSKPLLVLSRRRYDSTPNKVLYCVAGFVYDYTTPFEPRLSNVLCMLRY